MVFRDVSTLCDGQIGLGYENACSTTVVWKPSNASIQGLPNAREISEKMIRIFLPFILFRFVDSFFCSGLVGHKVRVYIPVCYLRLLEPMFYPKSDPEKKKEVAIR